MQADLSVPATWTRVTDHMHQVLADVRTTRTLFIHCAATLQPIGPAHRLGRGQDSGAQGSDSYTRQVVLNSAAPQVLGAAFVSAVANSPSVSDATLIMLSSGAASSVYEGWSAYCAGKAAVDHWVRTVGAEQSRLPHPVKVVAVSPGVVATGMQADIRKEDEADFPAVEKFRNLHADDALISPEKAAEGIWQVVRRPEIATGAVVDLRTLS